MHVTIAIIFFFFVYLFYFFVFVFILVFFFLFSLVLFWKQSVPQIARRCIEYNDSGHTEDFARA